MSELIPLLNVESVSTSIAFYLMCEDASQRRASLLIAGLAVSEMSREEYGNDEFALRDPDGYAIRFSSPTS